MPLSTTIMSPSRAYVSALAIVRQGPGMVKSGPQTELGTLGAMKSNPTVETVSVRDNVGGQVADETTVTPATVRSTLVPGCSSARVVKSTVCGLASVAVAGFGVCVAPDPTSRSSTPPPTTVYGGP